MQYKMIKIKVKMISITVNNRLLYISDRYNYHDLITNEPFTTSY